MDKASIVKLVAPMPAVALPSPGRHCHSMLSLTVVDCHSLAIYTLLLLSLLSFAVKMTVSPRASLTTPLHEHTFRCVIPSGDHEVNERNGGASLHLDGGVMC